MKKRKITDPSQLKAGMMVEYKYNGNGKSYRGVLKAFDNHLGLGLAGNITPWLLVDRRGELNDDMTDIHQIIDEQRTIEDLEYDDIIFDKDLNFRRCLGVCGEMYGLSIISTSRKGDNLKSYYNTYAMPQIKEKGWKLYIPEDESEIVELTLEEVAELKGVSVDKIRIKE